MRLTLANGTRTEGLEVTLRSVQLDTHRATNVKAVIVDQAPGAGVVGLLGNSFLKNFKLELEPSTGRLNLRDQ